MAAHLGAPLVVEWVSGASVKTGGITMCGYKPLYGLTIDRDANAPGLDKDRQFSMKSQLQREQQQPSANGYDAVLNVLGAFADGYNRGGDGFSSSMPPSPSGPSHIDCETKAAGYQLNTTCRGDIDSNNGRIT